VTSERRWLPALWPTVRSHLPTPPATVVEVGCGRFGGFVPRLRDSGYEALGIDPVAPEGDLYRQIEFERSDLPEPVHAVVACTSLHHVADPGEVLDKIANALVPAGLVIVVEWDWKRFDEATARWCFERLGPPEAEGWLQRRRDEWRASAQTWEDYLRTWTAREELHSAQGLLRELDRRFQRVMCDRGPCLFADLADTPEADELAAINAGRIQAIRIDYVGRLVG
jgi:SAM-dependent methyltransferase